MRTTALVPLATIVGMQGRTVSNDELLSRPTPRVQLTPRETEILELLIDGKANKVIAADLHISERCVKWHLSNLYRKLAVDCRVGAVSSVMRTAAASQPSESARSASISAGLHWASRAVLGTHVQPSEGEAGTTVTGGSRQPTAPGG